MGAGIEDVVALKALETAIVPPVPNYEEADPDLGSLNLSTGGQYPVEYALRLAAGDAPPGLPRRLPVAQLARARVAEADAGQVGAAPSPRGLDAALRRLALERPEGGMARGVPVRPGSLTGPPRSSGPRPIGPLGCPYPP